MSQAISLHNVQIVATEKDANEKIADKKMTDNKKQFIYVLLHFWSLIQIQPT